MRAVLSKIVAMVLVVLGVSPFTSPSNLSTAEIKSPSVRRVPIRALRI
jgi:hypothetical protein